MTDRPERINVRKQLNKIKAIRGNDDMIAKIERGCYKETRNIAQQQFIHCKWTNDEFSALYKIITYDVVSALDPSSDSYSQLILDQLIAGTLDPTAIGAMSPFELQPDRKTEADYIIKKSQGSGVSAVRASTFYTCHCGSELTHVRSVYSSRADEGVSKQVTCIKCGSQWNE